MTSFFYDKIGEYFCHKEEKCPACLPTEIEDFEPGFLASFGVSWISFFDELIIPDEIRKARGKCYKAPCCAKPPSCPPIRNKPKRPSCQQRQSLFPKSSC